MKTEIQLKDKIAYLLTRNHQTQKIERAALIILDRKQERKEVSHYGKHNLVTGSLTGE